MNIFYTSHCAGECAKALSNRHVCKMIVESAQMLSTSLRNAGYEDDWLYRSTHKNHPSTLWVCQSRDHFEWLLDHAFSISRQYTERYGKVHKTQTLLDKIDDLWSSAKLAYPDTGFQEPPQCMPEKYRQKFTTQAYRDYYIAEKMEFKSGPAKWPRNLTLPSWLNDKLKSHNYG